MGLDYKLSTFDNFKKQEFCGTCAYWNLTRFEKNDTCTCIEVNNRNRVKFDYSCKKYKKINNNTTLNSIYDALVKNEKDRNCYITTIVVNILGKEDNSEELETLRWFRNNVLHKDNKYISILAEYDKIGPIIASFLYKDKYSVLVAEYIEYYFLIPITKLIKNNEFDKAVDLYVCMVTYLKSLYKIDSLELTDYNEYADNTIISNRGHGGYQRSRK